MRTDMKQLTVTFCNFTNVPKIVLKEIFDNSVRPLWDLEYVGPMSHTVWGYRGLEPPLLNRDNENCVKYVPPSYALMKVSRLTHILIFRPNQHPV
jgi:hypothetical protein